MANTLEHPALTAEQATEYRAWLKKESDAGWDRATGRVPCGSPKSGRKGAETADDLLSELDRLLELPPERSGPRVAHASLPHGLDHSRTLEYAKKLRRMSRNLPYDSDYEIFATAAKDRFLKLLGVDEKALEEIDPLVPPLPVPGPGDDTTPLSGLSRARTMELWFWLWSGAESRENAIPDGGSATRDPETTRLRYEADMCLRVIEALEQNHKDESSYWHCYHVPIETRLARGLDPIGVLFFSRYLVHQAARWRARSVSGGAEREEATARLSVVIAASALFHRLLGATPMEVERRGKFVQTAEDGRRYSLGFRIGDVVIDDPDEGPITPEERDRRRKLAVQKVLHERPGGARLRRRP